MINSLNTRFDNSSQKVPPPQMISLGGTHVFRYVEKTFEQAIIQKLARILSGLNAALLLLENGFVQEQAVLQRTIDEFNDDVTFLFAGFCEGEGCLPELQEQYLSGFWEEEFDVPDDPVKSSQKRYSMPRRKIRAYLASVPDIHPDPSTQIELSRTLSKAYSGFVHGASPQIMDMVGGDPPGFHVDGMLGTPRVAEYAQDLCNYLYRSIASFVFASRLLGENTLADDLTQFSKDFGKHTGCLPD